MASWKQVSTLPMNGLPDGATAVVLNGEIHILGFYNGSDRLQNISHYKYSNGSWSKVSELPHEFLGGCAVIYNNEIHILGGRISPAITSHYKYSNGEWVEVSTLPYDFYKGNAVVINNEIHIFGSNNYTYSKKHYKFQNGSWYTATELPRNVNYKYASVVLNNEIHIIGEDGQYTGSEKRFHYKFVNSSGGYWQTVSTPTFQTNNSQRATVLLDNEIHIFGNNNTTGNKTQHYKYKNGVWTEDVALPYDFIYGSAVVLDNKIHILGGDNTTNIRKHYAFTPGYTITFNPNGGVVSPTSADTNASGLLSSLPTPTYSGYIFDGWFTAATGGTEITTSTVFNSDETIYAQWTEKPKYTITFNPNGGNVSPTTKNTKNDGTLDTLPIPTYFRHSFNGWFTEASGGTQITTSTVFTSNDTVFAQWTAPTRELNKIVYGNDTLIDLTNDTVTAADVINSKYVHLPSGERVQGTCSYDADTSDANAVTNDILTDKTAYVNGSKLTGTMPNHGAVSGSVSTIAGTYTIQSGYHNGNGSVGIDAAEAAKIIPVNIKKDISILGVTGTYEGNVTYTEEMNMAGGYTVTIDSV